MLQKVKKWILILIVIIGILMFIEYGILGLVSFTIFGVIYAYFNKLIIYKAAHCIENTTLSIIFSFLAIGLIGYMIIRFITGTGYIIAESYFLIAQILLGIIIVKIIVSLLYWFDSDLRLMDKLNSMKKKKKIRYSRFFGVHFFRLVLELILSFIVCLVIFWKSNYEFGAVINRSIRLFSSVTFFIILYMFLDKKYHYIIETFRPCSAKVFFVALIAGVGMYYLNVFMHICNYYYITEMLEIPSVIKGLNVEQSDIHIGSLSFRVVDFMAIVIMTPLLEELFFRGFVYTIIKNRYGFVKAVIISAVIFALVHADIYYRFIPLITAGLVLPYIYEKSRSLMAPIICHSVYNFIIIIF